MKQISDLIENYVEYRMGYFTKSGRISLKEVVRLKTELFEAISKKRLELITLPDKMPIEPGDTSSDAQFATGWNTCIEWIKAKG